MSDGMSALFWGVITFSIIVVLHEGGHFLTARMFGVKVHEFMVGLPGPALRFRGKETTYGITAVPLGGYVRIAGMEPGPEDPRLATVLAAITRLGSANAFDISAQTGIEEKDADSLLVTLADWGAVLPVDGDEYRYTSGYPAQDADDPHLIDRARAITYRGLPTWKRVVVLSAGVVLNLVTAILVFTIVLTAFGYLKETTTIGGVTKGGAAQTAGIRAGDKILEVDGQKITEWLDVPKAISGHAVGDTITVIVSRDGSPLKFEPTLGKRPNSNDPMLGIETKLTRIKPSPIKALGESVGYVGLTFKAIVGFFNPGTFRTSISQSSSVIGASYIAAQAAKTSPMDYAAIVAVLSLSLGVINILPIPPLDGGKIALEFIEKLRGRPLSRRLSLGLSVSGAVMLFALIGYLMYADVQRFIVR